ncbi:galactosylgalactosylxylosylprotein 3-beta-glucuronosyltransferase P isoform X2 [Drosophila virilis]
MLLPQAKESKVNENLSNKMALGKSIKMYLTIFIATTCIYMVLYQYHMSRQPLAANELVKHPEKSSSSSSSSSSYIASYLWAPPMLNNSSNSINTTMGQGLVQVHGPNATDTSSVSSSSSAASNSVSASGSSFYSTVSLPLTLSSASDANNKSISTTTTSTTTTTTTTVANAVVSATTTTTTTAQKLKTTTQPSHAHKSMPPLYIITPTYRRPEQLAELTRLGYTLKHVLNLLWLVIEDANKTNPLVAHTLDRIGVPYEYLVAPMPEQYKLTKRAKPRGVSNRNRGLDYLRANATEGVLYFADDDNTYDVNIFEQMRYTKKVSMWPVGLVTKTGVSSPIIREGKLDGYYDGWIGGRKYPVDMAGFAVSVKFLHERPHAKMPFKPGYEEDGFLRSLAPLQNNEIELLADECREILTWHTQTKKNPAALPFNQTRYGNTNLAFIEKLLVRP